MFTGGLISVVLVLVRLVFYVLHATEQEKQRTELRTWAERPDPKHRVRRNGVTVDVAIRRPAEDGPATSAVVRARWAFGSGPRFGLRRGKARWIGGEHGDVRSFVGEGKQYAVASDGAPVLGRLFSRTVVEGLDALPEATVMQATADGVELVMYDSQLDEEMIPRARKVVAAVAGFGTNALRSAVARIDGATVVEGDEGIDTHAEIPTRAGVAELDFELEDDGLTATLALEMKATGAHSAEIDAEGGILVEGDNSGAAGDGLGARMHTSQSILVSDATWLEHAPVQKRREIGPAKIVLDGEHVEIAWPGVPTSEQISRAVELLATLAAGAGPAYR